jgi:DNA-binding NarL/FixJ family response regulator
MIKVLIADDHKLVREGLKYVLTLSDADIEIIGEAVSGQEAISFLEKTEVDVVLMDIDMPGGNGIETTLHLKQFFPQVKVLMLTMAENEQFVHDSLKAGAKGYLLKSAGLRELLYAIRTVAEGEEYFSAEVTKMLLNKVTYPSPATAVPAQVKGQKSVVNLSAKEMEVLLLIADGYTNQQIADKTCTSKRTVESHRQSLLEKTGCNNTATLIRFAATHHLLD